MFCTGTFPDCWRFIEVLTSSFAQVFVEAGNLRFNRQPPTPKMHYPSCNSSWFSWFLYVFVMNTLHLSSVFPSFLYLGPWGCPQVPSPSMWVRMALFGARRSRTWQWESSGKVNLNTWCFFMFFPNLDPVDPVDSSIFPSLCGWHDGFFQHFPKFSGEIPGCSPIFRGTCPARPGVHGALGLLRRAPGGGERRRARGGGALAGGAAGLMRQSGATAATAGKWLKYHYTL